ncbi:Uncharacterised protein [Edwardsiella tarda]|nr:Uncharacterised protein [Edwardsiella tarda]
MKKILSAIAQILSLLFMLSLFNTANAEEFFKLQTGTGKNIYGMNTVLIRITSTSDNFVVKQLIVNRGNCKPWVDLRNVKLAFGKSQNWSYGENCEIVEANIFTNQGEFLLRDNTIEQVSGAEKNTPRQATSTKAPTNAAMSCTLTNGKIVAISNNNGSWAYTFGKNGKVEMAVNGNEHFLGNVDEGMKGTTTQVRVTNGDYSYVLYNAAMTDGNEDRLGVFNGTKMIAHWNCVSPYQINNALVSKLPNDTAVDTYAPF